MPIDASIYGQLQQPDYVGSVEKGMKLREMVDKRALEQQQLAQAKQEKEALKNSYVTDAQGNTTLDRKTYLSQLAKINPQKAMDQQRTFMQQDVEDQNNKYNQALHEADLVSRTAGTITDQASYEKALQSLHQNGVDTSKMPAQYDPNLVKQYQTMALSTKDRLDQQFKDRQLTQEKDLKHEEFQHQTELEAAKAGYASKLEAQKGQQAVGLEGVKGQNAQTVKQMELDAIAKKEQAKKFGGQMPDGVTADTDPATLVKYMVPEHHQAKVFGEIESAQNTAKNSKDILAAFDNAANNKHVVDLVPGVDNADQKQLHALLGPTFKDVEGTVRQAAMDNAFKNMTPQAFDSKDTKAKKRAALVDYLQSKSSAPTAAGYGIKLSDYNNSHMRDEGPPQKAAAAQQQALIPGHATSVGKIITTSQGTFRVGDDGDTLIPIQSSTAAR